PATPQGYQQRHRVRRRRKPLGRRGSAVQESSLLFLAAARCVGARIFGTARRTGSFGKVIRGHGYSPAFPLVTPAGTFVRPVECTGSVATEDFEVAALDEIPFWFNFEVLEPPPICSRVVRASTSTNK